MKNLDRHLSRLRAPELGLGLGLGLTRPGGGGGGAPTLPAGATGVWYASDYTATPRKMIKNSAVNGTADANLLTASRRQFSNVRFFTTSGTPTITDANATAPDGTTSASTLAKSTAVDWQLRVIGVPLTSFPAGTYTICCSVRLVSGSGDFRLGDNNGTLTAFTATGSWQRFAVTTTTGGTNFFPYLRAAATPAIQTLEICDFEIFAGSADLNPAPLSLAPLAERNGDLRIGVHAYDANSVVAGGYLVSANNAMSLLSLAANLSNNYTFVYVIKRTNAPSSIAYVPIASDAMSTGDPFMIGQHNGRCGARFNANYIDGVAGTVQQMLFNDLWAKAGGSLFTGANRYNGAVSSVFVNGVKGMKRSTVIAAPSAVKDLLLLTNRSNLYSGLELAAIAHWPSALTDAEVKQAEAALLAHEAKSVSNKKTIFFYGTSITNGFAGKSYPYIYANNASPEVHGFNGGVNGATVSAISTSVAAALTALSESPPDHPVIFSLEIGANDLNGSYTGDPSGLATVVATLCDSIRTAGYKVALHTVLNRTDAGGSIETQRNTYNGIIRTWVGTHVDAIIDVAADAVIGTATWCDDVNLSRDKIHPIGAPITGTEIDVYTTYWEPIARPILDAL